MNPIVFNITEADATNATRLGFLKTNKEKALRTILIIIIVAALVACITLFFNKPSFTKYFTAFGYILSFYLILYMLFLPLCYKWIIPHRVRKQFKQMPALSQEMQLSWTQEYFIFRSGRSVSEVPFSELHKWCVNENSITIYPSDLIHYMLPKHAFPNDESYIELQNRLRENGVREI